MKNPGQRRMALALGCGTCAGYLAGLVKSGLSVVGGGAMLCLGAVLAGAVIAAAVRGTSRRARVVFVVPFLIYATVLALATEAYLRCRGGRMFHAEVIVPAAVACVPFHFAHRAATRHAGEGPATSRASRS